jgi:hypothetical protein
MELDMNPSVYLETTFVSYLTAWPSRDLVRAAQQQTTREWWDTQRPRFDLFTSELVSLECAAGDRQAAADRLAVLARLPGLATTPAATELASALVAAGAVPSIASRDALHIGICATNGVNYLLTWNFRHLANAALRAKINDGCRSSGYEPPIICTPEELFEDAP